MLNFHQLNVSYLASPLYILLWKWLFLFADSAGGVGKKKSVNTFLIQANLWFFDIFCPSCSKSVHHNPLIASFYQLSPHNSSAGRHMVLYHVTKARTPQDRLHIYTFPPCSTLPMQPVSESIRTYWYIPHSYLRWFTSCTCVAWQSCKRKKDKGVHVWAETENTSMAKRTKSNIVTLRMPVNGSPEAL